MPGPAFDIGRQASAGALGGFESLALWLASVQAACAADPADRTVAADAAGTPTVPGHLDSLPDGAGDQRAVEAEGAAPSDSPGLTNPAVAVGIPVAGAVSVSDSVQTQAPDGNGQVDVLQTDVAPADDDGTPWAPPFAHVIAGPAPPTSADSANPLVLISPPASGDFGVHGFDATAQAGFAMLDSQPFKVGFGGFERSGAGPSASAGSSPVSDSSGHGSADTAHVAVAPAGLPTGVTTEASIGSGGATAAQVQQALNESGLSLNGAGIKVGVLSDSFNNLGGAAADEADGALPSAGHIQVLSDISSGGSDEGRAMMQIIHDIAPGANLAFYTAFNGEQDFANGILALAAAGCKVICDDVSYFDEPFFQNGIVAQAIQQVEAEGVTYVTAAGNEGKNGYEASWTPSAGTYDSISLADAETFGGSFVQTVTIDSGASANNPIPLLLEWDQAYGNATSNLELLVFKGGKLIDWATRSSYAEQGQGHFTGEPTNPAVEYYFTQGGPYQIAIENIGGPDPGLIKEITAGDGQVAAIGGANSGTVVGHAMTPGAITAGAVSAANTPAFGVNPPTIEGFSSSGTGTELLFDNNGNRLASPDVLSPVAVSGLDDISTTVSGGLSDFYGTSAASASVAGVAALILQANPGLTPAQVEQLMEETARPMGNSAVSGAGLVQVDAAIAASPAYVIRTDTNAYGSATLVEKGGEYFLDNGSTAGPALKYNGSPVTLGQFGHWAVIGAAPTASGYDVAWRLTGGDGYTVWRVDPSGNYAGSIVTDVPGSNLTLQVLERTFNQDLNHDGRIGPPRTDFVFDSPLGGAVVSIRHFSPAVDRIVLSASDFRGIRPIDHVLAAVEFHVGPHATAAAQRILYHPATGYIDYHKIGGGPHGLVHFAHVSPHLDLTHADFLVVA